MKVEELKDILRQCRITVGLTLVLGLLNLGFWLTGPQNEWYQSLWAFMEYNRERILGAELWRLFTGHWVHWSAEHFLLDALVFLIQGFAFEYKIGRRYGWMLMLSAAVISVALLLFQKELNLYRGVSGLINTQLVLGAGLFVIDPTLKKSVKAIYLSVFSIHLLKIAYETIFRTSFFATDALGHMGAFTPLAHLAGVLVGLGFLLPRVRSNRFSRPSPQGTVQ
ncbi:MAG: rhombosortase [Desulfobacteraceae bacterium]|nr:rhombosortase [Desulfobacteraceae bacterium]